MIKHKISKSVGNSSESKPKINITAINGDTTANSVPFMTVKEKEVSENNFEITHETRKLLPRKSKNTLGLVKSFESTVLFVLQPNAKKIWAFGRA